MPKITIKSLPPVITIFQLRNLDEYLPQCEDLEASLYDHYSKYKLKLTSHSSILTFVVVP